MELVNIVRVMRTVYREITQESIINRESSSILRSIEVARAISKTRDIPCRSS